MVPENDRMSNAQVALLAAAKATKLGIDQPSHVRRIRAVAIEFKTWLDEQDKL